MGITTDDIALGGAFGTEGTTDGGSLGGSFGGDISPLTQTLTGEAADSAAQALAAKEAAEASAAAALLSEQNADASEAVALSASQNASQSESNAQSSATAAASSAASAASDAASAATSETNAATSATQSASSATAALASKNAAATSETNAASSAATATTAANTATTKASEASTSASNALSSANNAATSAATATTKAGEASTSAAEAYDSQVAAAASEAAALLSEQAASGYANNASATLTQVELIFDQFGDQYLGAKTSDPTTDNDGDPLTQGDIYWNTTDSVLKFYSGTAWVAPESIATTQAVNAANSAASASDSADASALSAASSATSANESSASAAAALISENNASTSEANAAASEIAAATSEANAATSASNAATSELNAATSETNAANSAAAALLSEQNAFTSETNAATSATNSSDSASLAEEWATKTTGTVTGSTEYSSKYYSEQSSASADASASSASNSAISASNSADSAALALTSETNAAASEAAALLSEQNAATSETNAATSETNAATSESNAALSEANAATSASNASSSELAAATSEANASASEAAASLSETNAADSEANAASSASTASTAATTAVSAKNDANTSKVAAAASATAAATSATQANTSATSAATYASNSATSATNASASEGSAFSYMQAAQTAKTAAELALDQFTDLYLGAKTTEPTLDNDGNPLQTGALYANVVDSRLYFWTGSLWAATLLDANLQTQIDNAINDVVANAPVDLNTLEELAAAINNDPAFSTTINTALATKVTTNSAASLASLTFTGSNYGTLSWNPDDETLDLTVSADVTYQLGQELGVVARNLSGQALTNGSVVRVTGASGNKITCDLADNTSEALSSSTFAIVTETIDNNSTGRITTEGLVRGLDTSTFTEGVAIWLGSNGEFTATKPTSPNHLVHLGWVVRSHATEGSILVHISNGWELDELHDVNITSLTEGDTIRWNNTTHVWENVPYTLDEITTHGNTTTNSITVGDVTAQNVVVEGDLTVNGTTTTVNATNLAIADNMIYLNEGNTTANVDLGWAGNYNDGTYAHAGFFRDATDGKFKAYQGYTPEPDAAADIDTTHASFALADIQAATFHGNLTGNATSADTWSTARTITLGGDLTGNVAIDGSANATLTANVVNYNDTNWDTAYGWGDHAAAGYLTSYTETDPVFSASTASSITATDLSNWNAAYNDRVTSLSFNTTNGVLTATQSDGGTVTVDLDNRYKLDGTFDNYVSWTISDGTNSEAIASGNTLKIVGAGASSTSYDAVTNTLTITSTDTNTDTNTTYSAGSGLSLSGTTFSHADTSSQASVNNSGATVIQDVTLDTYGHITGLASKTLTYSDVGAAAASHTHNYLPLSGGTMTGVITTPNGTHGIIVGDDSRLADRNVANTLFVEGGQTNTAGYINFGQTTGAQLGISGTNAALTWKGNTVWHAGNDGANSGLDADLLDGQHASAFATAGHGHTGLSSNSWGGITSSTSSGYIDFGPANTSWAHIYTDRPAFYFNKDLYVNNYKVWTAGNDGSSSGLDADLLDGNHASAFALSGHTHDYVPERNRSDWNDGTVLYDVVGQLAWRNYGNNHTIFDASASQTPSNTAKNNTNPDVAWSATYPTLMGWNGTNTYGVRVDRARYVDINYNNNSNSTYQMLWGSGNGVFGTAGIYCNPSTNSIYTTDLYVDDQIISTGDTDTYMQFHAADQWRVVTGGVERLEVNNGNTTVQNTLVANNSIVTDYVSLNDGSVNSFLDSYNFGSPNPSGINFLYGDMGVTLYDTNSYSGAGIFVTPIWANTEYVLRDNGSAYDPNRFADVEIARDTYSPYGPRFKLNMPNQWNSLYGKEISVYNNSSGLSFNVSPEMGFLSFGGPNGSFDIDLNTNQVLLNNLTLNTGGGGGGSQYTLFEEGFYVGMINANGFSFGGLSGSVGSIYNSYGQTIILKVKVYAMIDIDQYGTSSPGDMMLDLQWDGMTPINFPVPIRGSASNALVSNSITIDTPSSNDWYVLPQNSSVNIDYMLNWSNIMGNANISATVYVDIYTV